MNSGPLIVDAINDASPASSFHPALTVKGGAKIEKNILTKSHLFVEEGNVFAKNVNCKGLLSEFSVNDRIVVNEINEFDIGKGIVINGNINLRGGDFSGNLRGNVVLKQNANVYQNLTVSKDSVIRGNLSVYQNAVFDGEIKAWKDLVVFHDRHRITVGETIYNLSEMVRKQQKDIEELKLIVSALRQQKSQDKLQHRNNARLLY